jgi:hypothetical protein
MFGQMRLSFEPAYSRSPGRRDQNVVSGHLPRPSCRQPTVSVPGLDDDPGLMRRGRGLLLKEKIALNPNPSPTRPLFGYPGYVPKGVEMENGKSFRCTQLLPRRSITPTKPCYDYQIAGGTSAGPHTARASGLSSLFQGGCSIQSFVRAASSSRNPHKSDVPANVSEVVQPRWGVAWLAR